MIEDFLGKSDKIGLDALAEMGDNQIGEDTVFGEVTGCEMNLDETVHDKNYQTGFA